MNKEISLYSDISKSVKTFNLSIEKIFGFFEGDGSLTIQLKPNLTHKIGKQVILIFEIHQHAIDLDFLKAISIYLNIGKVEIGRKVGNPENWVYRLRISKQSDIIFTLLPLLESQAIEGMMLKKRNSDILIFIEACRLVKEKNHFEMFIAINGANLLV